MKRYRIERVIGRGGFAAVYRADDERLGRPVAVKVITLTASDDEAREELRERFQREARAAASLPQHPNIVTIHDYGTDPELDLDFLVMEYLVGEDLATYLARQRRLPLDAALRILLDAVQGIAVGHQAGLIHRDVKPGNIFLAEPYDDHPFRVCVLDFGIARATTADQTVTRVTRGGVPLSPAYASPEQLRGETDLTPASDVFSLGVVAYQLLTGEKPLRADRTHEPSDWVPDRRIGELNREVPPHLEAIVVKAMSFAIEDRYANAEEMLQALQGPAQRTHPRPDARTRAAPSASPGPAPDHDRTLLQPPVGASPSHNGTPGPRRRSLSTWVVLLLLVAIATVAGLWVLTRGATPDPGDAPGSIIIDEPAPPDPTGTEGQAPRVTGEIVEPPSPAPVAPGPAIPPPEPLPAFPAPPAVEAPAPDVEEQGTPFPPGPGPTPAEIEAPAPLEEDPPEEPDEPPPLLGVPVQQP